MESVMENDFILVMEIFHTSDIFVPRRIELS